MPPRAARDRGRPHPAPTRGCARLLRQLRPDPDPRAGVLILARHGQTTANASGLLLGRADLPLTDLGRRQAEAIASTIHGAARVVSSPLRRALETAAMLSNAVEVDERWVEVDYGQYDMLPLRDVP